MIEKNRTRGPAHTQPSLDKLRSCIHEAPLLLYDLHPSELCGAQQSTKFVTCAILTPTRNEKDVWKVQKLPKDS
jgi:hypothetical protein